MIRVWPFSFSVYKNVPAPQDIQLSKNEEEFDPLLKVTKANSKVYWKAMTSKVLVQNEKCQTVSKWKYWTSLLNF